MRNSILVISAVFILISGNARANEEDLYYKLEKVWKYLRQSRLILVEGISNLNNLDYNLSLIAIRFEQIHDSLVVSRNTMDQVHKGYVKILDELVAKRGRPRIIEDYSARTCKPLAQINDPKTGDLFQVEKSIEELVQVLNQNQKPKAAALQSALGKYDRLLDNIEKVLLACCPPPNCSRLTEMLVEIEIQQRTIAERLWRHFCQQQISPFRLLDE